MTTDLYFVLDLLDCFPDLALLIAKKRGSNVASSAIRLPPLLKKMVKATGTGGSER